MAESLIYFLLYMNLTGNKASKRSNIVRSTLKPRTMQRLDVKLAHAIDSTEGTRTQLEEIINMIK